MSGGLKLRRAGTFVKARDVEAAMILAVSGGTGGSRVEKIVARVERAADAIDRTRIAIGKTSSRKLLEPLADELVKALEAVDIYGREARLVTLAGERTARIYTSQEELRYIRRATGDELASAGL